MTRCVQQLKKKMFSVLKEQNQASEFILNLVFFHH